MALQHIVWLKPRPGSDATAIDALLGDIKGLADRIPGVTGISGGRNLTHRSQGYTHCAVITLDRVDRLGEYLDHPEHKKVAARIGQLCDLLVMDFEDLD
jgi:hypothetical protein